MYIAQNSVTKFLLFRIKCIIDKDVYLITDTYNYFITPMSKWTYSFIT